MSQQAVKQHQIITLKGSATMVAEFFAYAANSVLYQRGIYPAEAFKGKAKYGLTVMVTTDPTLSDYIQNHTQQVEEWLANDELERLVIDVVRAYAPYDVLERWTFAVETDKEVVAGRKEVTKPEEQIRSEIMAIIRQITASVTYLPLLNDPCTFLLRFVVASTATPPTNWEDSPLDVIANAQDMKLRSFSTKVHKVDTMVTYQADDME